MNGWKSDRIRASEITPEAAYVGRRQLIAGAAAAGATSLLPSSGQAERGRRPLKFSKSAYSTKEPVSRFREVTLYNNFVEFGARKTDPAYFAQTMTTDPWQVVIDGLVGKPVTVDLDAVLRSVALEERIYRLRCVEAWSMVIPWIGFPLSALLKRVEPLGSAKYVAFETLARPSEMRGLRKRHQVLPWPYREGLRLDEAMHPLTILAVGMYGRTLPNQNGAPLRLVVPWKYGFKSIKSIVRITLSEERPFTSWHAKAPGHYGFFANVNPLVAHPDWSQATERRVGFGSALFSPRRQTLMFNGYQEQVTGLYKGMDLTQNY